MKIYRLFGVLFLAMAVALIGGCGGGKNTWRDSQSTLQDGANTGEEGVGVSGGELDMPLQSGEAMLCPGNAILPLGKNAYSQYLPNQLINSRTPFFYNLMMDQIDKEGFDGVPKYGDYIFGGQVSNNWAVFNEVDQMTKEIIGTNLNDVTCIVAAYENINKNFCADGGDIPCFNSWTNILSNMDRIPFIGGLVRTLVQLMPSQYADFLTVFNTIPAPDPYALTLELLTNTEFQIVVDGWQEGSLANFNLFMQYLLANYQRYMTLLTEAFQAGMAQGISLPPQFNLMRAQAQTPAIELRETEYDNCIQWVLGAAEEEMQFDAGVDFEVANPFANGGMVLELCEYDGFLTIANAGTSADEIRNQAIAYLAGQSPISFLDDQCYKQTYYGLWNESMGKRAPDLLACLNVNDMQLSLLSTLNGRVAEVPQNLAADFSISEPQFALELPAISNPFVSLMPIMDEEIEMFRLGILASLDYKSEFKFSVQLFEPSEGVIFSRGDKAAGADTIVGYSDIEFGANAKVSSRMTDAIDMQSYLGQEVLSGVDGYNIPAAMMVIFEQALTEYQASQLE